MDLSKLKSFIVLAEELNFRKSAEILGISQPPLTRLISSLEEELSTKLFERTTRQVQLTGAGIFLLKEGKEIIARAENLEREVRSIGKLKAGKLNIGFSTTSFLANLPQIIDEFQNRFPKLKFQLHQETRIRIPKGLRSGHFDVCFMEGTVSEEDLESRSVHDEGLGVLVPKKHPLAKRKEIELRELKDETIILHPKKEAGKFYDTISQLFKQSGIKPKLYVKNDRESCPILVATGKGVSLTVLGAQNIAPSETQFVPIKKLFLPVSVFWAPENKNPLLKTFLSFVIESDSFKNKKAECLMDVMRL
ncbi:LysR family transcriptional regulator [Leptospira kmetyi]|uniref:LysR substrate-binding domain-containing protein n=1 Tax=Leptospira kmetyi TaxID=408139 RepID=UPI0002F29618|nr:LysR family transcriptional regulator [Leptospira kmetyi]EQA55480.1 LysR substrate-binding domain protein [Leptospira kmetyi serovar Malaysia str. Bejo-Iso9]TGK12984.1 LysR family transcriptional regulator [Leptospira kmetyi]TGK34744.1 LysR family transcriptional regulator [Leptospira kmetyi]